MYQILLVSFLVVSVALVGLILVQHGKGADMGASFGAGASNTVFGSSGSGNFLSRTTAILAALFFSIALGLGYLTSHNTKPKTDDIATAIEQTQNQNEPNKAKEVSSKASEMSIPDVEVKKDAGQKVRAVPDVPVEKKNTADVKTTTQKHTATPASKESKSKKKDDKGTHH